LDSAKEKISELEDRAKINHTSRNTQRKKVMKISRGPVSCESLEYETHTYAHHCGQKKERKEGGS
jgi:hypothetical protein